MNQNLRLYKFIIEKYQIFVEILAQNACDQKLLLVIFYVKPYLIGHFEPLGELHGFSKNELQISFSKLSFFGNSGNNPTALPAINLVSAGAVKLIAIKNFPFPKPYLP